MNKGELVATIAEAGNITKVLAERGIDASVESVEVGTYVENLSISSSLTAASIAIRSPRKVGSRVFSSSIRIRSSRRRPSSQMRMGGSRSPSCQISVAPVP